VAQERHFLGDIKIEGSLITIFKLLLTCYGIKIPRSYFFQRPTLNLRKNDYGFHWFLYVYLIMLIY